MRDRGPEVGAWCGHLHLIAAMCRAPLMASSRCRHCGCRGRSCSPFPWSQGHRSRVIDVGTVCTPCTPPSYARSAHARALDTPLALVLAPRSSRFCFLCPLPACSRGHSAYTALSRAQSLSSQVAVVVVGCPRLVLSFVCVRVFVSSFGLRSFPCSSPFAQAPFASDEAVCTI